MPRGDRTGPLGSGPMTGRRMGNCAENENANAGFGFGRGFFGRAWGRGQGAGYRRGFGFFQRSDDFDLNDENSIGVEIKTMKSRLSFLEKLLIKNKTAD